MKLTDNPNVPVYHFRKFLPKDYKPIKDSSRLNDKESILFHNEKEKRVAMIKIAEDCFWLECYYVEPFPNGVFYNIDWNDTLFLECCKLAGKQNVLALVGLLHERGYKFQRQFFTDIRVTAI